LQGAASTSCAAFDEAAASYDAIEADNPIWQWMRKRVQRAALSVFPRNALLLDVGCGTGADALFFAQRGYRLVAMDPSEDMLAVAAEKIAVTGFSGSVEFVRDGAERMDKLSARYGAAGFDGIFSNFGALNCVEDLRRFARRAGRLLRPEGKMVLSLMPPLCPWEIFYYLLRGHPAKAFRRWRGRSGTRGVVGRVGNQPVQTYYHSRAAIARAFAENFFVEGQFALGLFVPPPYLYGIARHQKFFKWLMYCEERLAGWPLLREMGDHLVVILRKRM
jgi:ubiquinone/menaquinone biosynthesis C-methylase UbiE